MRPRLIDCAYIEVGKYLHLPTQAYTGMSDSKTLDAQAGFESGGGLYLAALAGVNSVSGPVMLARDRSKPLHADQLTNQPVNRLTSQRSCVVVLILQPNLKEP